DAGEQEPEVVVDLGDGPHRGPRVLGRRLLVDGDGRRQALDEVDVGLLHQPEELAGVRRQALDVPPLALGVDRVEGERRFSRPGETGEDDEMVARQLQADVLQVVLARTPDPDRLGPHVITSMVARPKGPSPNGCSDITLRRMDIAVSPLELLRWSEALAGVARTGLGFTQSLYERERFEEVLKIAADMRVAA